MKKLLPYFTEHPKLSYAHEESFKLGKNYWRVENTFTFVSGKRGGDYSITVPKGFLTDGASVPRILWCLFPPFGRYLDAAIVHDYLCETCAVEIMGKEIQISRKDVDSIFLDIMSYHKVWLPSKIILYSSVRIWALLMGRTGPIKDKRKSALEKKYFF